MELVRTFFKFSQLYENYELVWVYPDLTIRIEHFRVWMIFLSFNKYLICFISKYYLNLFDIDKRLILGVNIVDLNICDLDGNKLIFSPFVDVSKFFRIINIMRRISKYYLRMNAIDLIWERINWIRINVVKSRNL